MASLYNPDWRKQGLTWTLTDGNKIGVIKAVITRSYSWEVFAINGGDCLTSGSCPDLVSAQHAVEKELGYSFFVEKEYVLAKGCRCGSCQEDTGKWLVWNREDTINMSFDSEGEALAWIIDQHASD